MFFSMKGWAKGIAKTQLFCYYSLKSKYPNVPNNQLYSKALLSRPGYNAETVDEIMKEALNLAREHGPGTELKFWMVVMQLAAYEYETHRKKPAFLIIEDIIAGINSVIPKDI